MKNIICIDLTSHNREKIIEIANTLGLDPKSLLDKKNIGFSKIFIDSEGYIIAFTTKKNKKRFVYTPKLSEKISKIEPFILSEGDVENMTVDSILDKISKHGIGSLTNEEKIFLEKNA